MTEIYIRALMNFLKKDFIFWCSRNEKPENIDSFFRFLEERDLIHNTHAEEYRQSKIRQIEAGDTVQIIDTGKQFTSFERWLIENVTDKKYLVRFAYGREIGDINKIECNRFEVITVADGVALIQDTYLEGVCYLFKLEGLEKVF